MRKLLLRIFGLLPEFARGWVVRVLYPTFTAGTAIIIERDDGRILLVTQTYTKDWSLPGGLMGRAETPQETAVREVKEELGIDVHLADQNPLVVRTSRRVHFTFVFHLVLPPEVTDRITSVDTDEITATEWFAPDALPPLFDDTDLYLRGVGLLD